MAIWNVKIRCLTPGEIKKGTQKSNLLPNRLFFPFFIARIPVRQEIAYHFTHKLLRMWEGLCCDVLYTRTSRINQKYYIVSGQHLMKAVDVIRQRREEQGLDLLSWMREVSADVLKPDVPIKDRKTIAGSENANARLQRTSTISECLELFMSDGKSEFDDVHQRIADAVEQSGLNFDKENPVCFVFGLLFEKACIMYF